ncbi:GDSL-type esterase/lipase family protein [Lentisphaera marina]|uniref:GDSL-type esterase/lipase family protein n=1 Tax=Lentisphaera marina TaxID=1111041 RepID=UPI002366BD10|nr:GDSL-type esterase/lipase family protein [Lentisphaera marina]MDD7983991.1 GDSL-type esterase/lipase family protein [Lentisphaera marina]
MKFIQILIALCFFISLSAQDKIKVACVGDSITFGAAIKDRVNNSYPAQLGKKLGEQWEVKNFGISGRTLLTKGNAPYVNSPQYKAALAFQPDVVIIKLGTNDTKPQNWQHKKDYASDYKKLIQSFQKLESQPAIWLCKAVPVFPERWGISNQIVQKEINPLVEAVAKEMGLPVIDLYTPLKNRPECFPDKVHPNAEGARIMVDQIAPLLKKHGKKLPAITK